MSWETGTATLSVTSKDPPSSREKSHSNMISKVIVQLEYPKKGTLGNKRAKKELKLNTKFTCRLRILTRKILL